MISMVELRVRIPKKEYEQLLALSTEREVSLTDALRGCVYTEIYLREKVKAGYKILLTTSDKNLPNKEIKFHNVRETKISTGI